MTTATQALKTAKYNSSRVDAICKEFHFKVFPKMEEGGIAVGYGNTVKEAREMLLMDEKFNAWFEKNKVNA
jgi:hypothetical protein